MLARRLGFPEEVQQTVRFSLEQWDGKGPVYGMKGDQIPVTSRIVHLAQVCEVAHRFGGASAVVAVAKQRGGKDFDPVLASTLLELSARDDFWRPLQLESAQQTILGMKPPSTFDSLSDGQVETFCEVVADFTDIRSQQTWSHSQVVATIVVGIGRQIGLGQEELTGLRRAALVHDLGKAALPFGIVEKEDDLSEGEWERFRLHPYYTDRILSRVEQLKPLVPVAAAHHEWANGQGYHRQLSGEQIPLGGRILAVADTYAILSKRADPADPEDVLQEMRFLVGTHLDGDCFEALVASLSGAPPPVTSTPRRQRPGNLSEREMELLRELAKGLGNKQIARNLVISEKTVEHHLENIYNKLGISSRTSAVVFAVQNGIVT